MQMEKTSSRRRKALQFGTVVGVTAAAVLTFAGPSWASADTATLNPVSGAASTAVPITISVASQSSPANSFIAGTTFVEFQATATCNATQTGTPTTVLAANVTVINPTKLALSTPATLTTGAGSGSGPTYSVCAYNATGGALLAGANVGYSVGVAPTLTSWSPKASSTQGGGTIVVAGTNLLTTTATIGGVSVGGWAINAGGTVATGTIPAHGVGSFPLIVTVTGGGSVTQSNAFSFGNGVVVTPNYGSNSKVRTDISVSGTNLAGTSFGTTTGTTPDDSNGHVYLTKGIYDPTKSGLVKTNGEVSECLNVLPISNTELVCSLYLSGVGGVPVTATRTVSGTVTGSVLSATAGNFGPGDVGETVTGATSLGTNNFITSVIDPTKVMLAKPVTAAITAATTLTLNPQRAVTDITFANASNAITSVAGAQFSPADVGRVLAGTSITSPTITAVTSPTTATISANSSGVSSGSYTITATKASLPPVPIGTYTIAVVNNGTPDAQGVLNYDASVVSSGSTFTVADF